MRRLFQFLLFVLLVASSVGCGDDGGTALQNQAPTLSVPDSVLAVLGVPVTFVISAADPEGDELTVTVVPLLTVSEFRLGVKAGPSSFDPATGEVVFTPALSDMPRRFFKALAEDTHGNTQEAGFPVVVAMP